MKTVYFSGPHHPIFETIVKYPPQGYRIISNMRPSDYSGGFIKEHHGKKFSHEKNFQ